jgi:hypothetical protein
MLVAMQKIMEEALFFWAKEEVPRLLVMAGWETPEAGELNWYSPSISTLSILIRF